MLFTYLKNGKVIKSEDPKDLEVSILDKEEHYKVLVKAKEDVTLISVSDEFLISLNPDAEIFFNGYQSWTDSKEVKTGAKEHNIYRAPRLVVKSYGMDKYGDATFYKYKRYLLHGYDIAYCKKGGEFFIFSQNYQNAYLLIEYNKRNKKITLLSDVKGKKLNKDESFVVYDYVYSYSYQNGLDLFKKAFPNKDREKLFGYTSWYNYYQNINEKRILNDLKAIDNRFNLFQIDDGYQTHVGDWLDINKEKFPNGLKPIVDKIHEKGLKAGLWLAPFVVEQESNIYKNHPDYLIKDDKGEYVKCGSNWSGSYALDLENADVINYLKKCLTHYMDMGFDFFKLDFLYACAVVIPEGYTRCEYQLKCYRFLKDTLKDKIILGCGANIINSYNNFDYLRVGPDVSLKFDDLFYMKMFHRERISTKTTLQNTIFRSIFNNHLFANDPDVFLLRDDNIELSKEQKYSLAMINSLFSGVLMTSDNIAYYDEEKKRILDKVLDNFLNARNASFVKDGHVIHISYELHNQIHSMSYDFKKGVMKDGR